jgi:hypothetical protein
VGVGGWGGGRGLGRGGGGVGGWGLVVLDWGLGFWGVGLGVWVLGVEGEGSGVGSLNKGEGVGRGDLIDAILDGVRIDLAYQRLACGTCMQPCDCLISDCLTSDCLISDCLISKWLIFDCLISDWLGTLLGSQTAARCRAKWSGGCVSGFGMRVSV